MRKRTKLILLSLLTIFIVWGVVIYSNKNNDYGNVINEKLYEITNEIIMRNPGIEDYSDLERITEEEKNIIKESSNKELLSKLYFVEGFFEKINCNLELAKENFEKSLNMLDDYSYEDMQARIYYEQSSIFLRENEEEKSKAIFEKINDIYKNEKEKNKLLKLAILRGTDLLAYGNRNNETIDFFHEVLELAKEIDYEHIVDIYYSLGLAYWYDDQKIQAINYKLEALNIAHESEDSYDAASMSIDIGIDFLETGNYGEAIRYIKSAIEDYTDEDSSDSAVKTYAWLNLYEAYSKSGYYEEAKIALDNAEFYLNKQEDDKRKYDDKVLLEYNRADLLTRLGNVNEAQAILDKCIEAYNNSINIFSYLDFDIMLTELQGNIYYKSGQYYKALEYHLEVKRIAEERELLHLRETYNQYLYMDYFALGDYKNAYHYAEINNTLKNESKNNQDAQYSQYLLSKFSNDKREMRILHLEKSQKITRNFFMLLAVITIFSIIFTSIILKKNREIKRLNELFKAISVTDGLTNIPNRRALDEFLSSNWNLYRKTKAPISFIMTDIDYFKKYNDNYGHLKGDEVLKKVAKCIKSSCRKSDFVARYGGEEFIIIMLNTNKEEAGIAAARILENVQKLNIKHEYSEVSDSVTISMGIFTAYSDIDKTYDTYVSMADSALYEAKKIRNTFRYKE